MTSFQNSAPIGVMDSGVGGLTVVRQLQSILPGEDILYYGDSANCPYGNRTPENIEQLSRKTLDFLAGKGVKAVAIACNTISALVENLKPHYDFPVLGIIAPAARAVAEAGLEAVGLVATEFTVTSGNYDKLIHALRPQTEVVAKGSPSLAALVDSGAFDDDAIDAEIREQVGDILSRRAVSHLILGCTHYPIVEENFRRCFPALRLIDPAREEAAALLRDLTARNLLNPAARGRFSIYTSGDPAVYRAVAKKLNLTPPDAVRQLAL